MRGGSIVSALAHDDWRADIAVEVYTTTPGARDIPGAAIFTLPIAEVENAENLLARVVGELKIGWSAARSMLRHHCDYAIISTPGYLAALVIAWYSRRKGVPYVLELRDIYPQVYVEANLIRNNSMLCRFFSARSRVLYEKANLVICATQGLLREVTKAAPRARATYVYNGFPGSLLHRNSTKYGRFTVCFHGTMGFFQDIESLVTIAARLEPHDIDVEVIGYGRKESLLRDVNLKNLRFHGRLTFEDTISMVEKCHIGLCLRLDDEISKDAFPVKVWEYLGLGLPSLVTPCCEAGAFLERNGCGKQFPAGSIEEMVAEILNLKTDPARLETLSVQCRRISGRYTREATGQSVADLIMDMVRGGCGCKP